MSWRKAANFAMALGFMRKNFVINLSVIVVNSILLLRIAAALLGALAVAHGARAGQQQLPPTVAKAVATAAENYAREVRVSFEMLAKECDVEIQSICQDERATIDDRIRKVETLRKQIVASVDNNEKPTSAQAVALTSRHQKRLTQAVEKLGSDLNIVAKPLLVTDKEVARAIIAEKQRILAEATATESAKLAPVDDEFMAIAITVLAVSPLPTPIPESLRAHNEFIIAASLDLAKAREAQATARKVAVAMVLSEFDSIEAALLHGDDRSVEEILERSDALSKERALFSETGDADRCASLSSATKRNFTKAIAAADAGLRGAYDAVAVRGVAERFELGKAIVSLRDEVLKKSENRAEASETSHERDQEDGVASRSLSWAVVIRFDPDPSVVSDRRVRDAITALGLPWHVRDRKTGIEMLLMPPRDFERGAGGDDALAKAEERPRHLVRISKPYYLGRFEVTNQEWARVLGKGESGASAHMPVGVAWNDIQEFLSKSGGLVLPTEAQWEMAAGVFGEETHGYVLDRIAWYADNSGSVIHKVGGKQPNSLGFYDMIGNAWEWCADWHDGTAYRRLQGLTVDPVVANSGGRLAGRVIRGGGIGCDETMLRATCRRWLAPEKSNFDVGFRVCRTHYDREPAETENIRRTIIGTWSVSIAGMYTASWTFEADGRVKSTEQTWNGRLMRGTNETQYEIREDCVYIDWPDPDHWDSFRLPLDPAGTTGDSHLGVGTLFASKK